jgi:hypothetical protein
LEAALGLGRGVAVVSLKGWPVEMAGAWTSFVLEGLGIDDDAAAEDVEEEEEDAVRAAAGSCNAPRAEARNWGAAALTQQFVRSEGERQQ